MRRLANFGPKNRWGVRGWGWGATNREVGKISIVNKQGGWNKRGG